MPRLCIALVLKGRTDELLVLLGMKCSSFSIVNLGTSRRAVCCPWGDWTKPSVRFANAMASRKLFAHFFELQLWYYRSIYTVYRKKGDLNALVFKGNHLDDLGLTTLAGPAFYAFS